MANLKQIFSNNWHMLTGQQIVELFDKHLGDVTIQPNMFIVNELKALEVATLECLENRTGSTVYRIRQTGNVYQLCQPDGDLFTYDDYGDYQTDEQLDKLIELYGTKEPVFTIKKENDNLYIYHNKPPKFKGLYNPNDALSNIVDIEWEEEPDIETITKLLRKAGDFLNSYAKQP